MLILLILSIFSVIPTMFEVLFIRTRFIPFFHGILYLPYMLLCSGLYPVYLSYLHQTSEAPTFQLRDTHSMASSPSGKVVDLKYVLEIPEGHDAFLQFLKNEFSVENLMFYEEATAFYLNYSNKENAGDFKTMQNDALHIFSRYIIPSAPTAVNLPGGIRQPLVQFFSQLQEVNCPSQQQDMFLLAAEDSTTAAVSTFKPEIFDNASHYIFRLMQQDSFVRFKKTLAFKGIQYQFTKTPARSRSRVFQSFKKSISVTK